ncbi:RNA polymerase sigma factor [Tumebacillus flagellatus]|uniref:RNA polymerase sigma factor n=1 Tax=Tumebacillus flagellatus TaxID=1157490 RepID=UPI00069192CC|nr:RNA polymerase sigma factor [Tumebacillus flagellatus]
MERDWKLIYSLYANDVYRFLLYYAGSREEAEDLTQDVFLKVLAKLPGFEERSQLKTWIIAIARNLALDHLRKRNRMAKLAQWLGRQPAEAVRLPEDLLYQSEQSRTLHAAIQTLKEEYRIVVILRGIQELTPAQTAEVLGWNQNKVNLVYHRAMKSLHKKLKQQGEDSKWNGKAI